MSALSTRFYRAGLTLLVDPERAQLSSQIVFDEIYNYWLTLPEDARPKLYLHGLSLGAFGSEASTKLYKIFDHPISGALWSGPPFPSSMWGSITASSRILTLPHGFLNLRMVLWFGLLEKKMSFRLDGAEWGTLRLVYLEHPSDAMVFFSARLTLY